MGITGIAPTLAPPLKGPYYSGNASGLWHYLTHKRFSNLWIHNSCCLIHKSSTETVSYDSFIVIEIPHLLALRFSFLFTHGTGQHLSILRSGFFFPERLHWCYLDFRLLLPIQLLEFLSNLVHWVLRFRENWQLREDGGGVGEQWLGSWGGL
jgi:hypothetical protein